MKDNYNYPKTLRSYNQPLSYYSSKKSRPLEEQSHNINEYCMLPNPKQSHKVKKKNQKKTIDLDSAIKKKLSNSKPCFQMIVTQNYDHCRSLQRLQLISKDRSDQVIKLMEQKGFLINQNQELKTKLANPTFRQTDLHGKIAKYENELSQLRDTLNRKDEQLKFERQQRKKQIQQIRRMHIEQINRTKEEYSRMLNNKQVFNSQNEISYTKKQMNKPSFVQVNANSYYAQPKIENANLQPNIKVYGNSLASQHNLISTSMNNMQRKYQHNQNQSSKQEKSSNVTSYIGQDGYQRRIVNYKNGSSQKEDTVKFNNGAIDYKLNLNIQNVSQKQKWKEARNIQSRELKQTKNYIKPSQTYSSSLTYQCFNDIK